MTVAATENVVTIKKFALSINKPLPPGTRLPALARQGEVCRSSAGGDMSLRSGNEMVDSCPSDEHDEIDGGSFERSGQKNDGLFSTTYWHLKQIARRTRSREAHTLNTTGLVHELFLKLRMGSNPEFDGKPQFFTYAARAMRHILLDRAIRRARTKLGGDVVHTDISDPSAQQAAIEPDLARQLDSALRVLEERDVRAARTFELHYFTGLEMEKVAEILGVSKRTADRDWRFARAFLSAHMEP